MKDKNIADPFYLQIQGEVDRVEKKADRFTWIFYAVRILQIVLTGLITVLSGLGNGAHITQILWLGATATALTAADALMQIDTKKNTYKLVLFELRSIRAELVYHCMQNDGKILPECRAELFEKYRKAASYARELIISENDSPQPLATTPPKNQLVPASE